MHRISFKNLAIVSIFSLNFISCASKNSVEIAEPKTKLTVNSQTASEHGFMSNSHLIAGPKEAILVDAQFTRSDARKVVNLVRRSGKQLKTIWITHAHPDHYFGLEILLNAFPKAEVLARPETLSEIEDTAEGKWGYWKPLYQKDLLGNVKKVVDAIKPFEGTELRVDGHKVEVVDFKRAESERSSGLYVPALKALFPGDLIYSKVHLWLADKDGNPEGWKRQLKKIGDGFDIEKIYPGHGSNGGLELAEINLKYIEAFEDVIKRIHDKQDAKNKMRALYPDYKLPVIADLSVDLHFVD